MARKPNYRFERNERSKSKAAKRQAKLEEKAARRQAENEPTDELSDAVTPSEED